MRIATTLLLVALFTATCLAGEYLPEADRQVTVASPVSTDFDRVLPKPPVITEPVWHNLVTMTQAEKENSEIMLILEINAADHAVSLAHRIENLWNNGQYQKALALFLELEQVTDISKMSIGNSWRIPIPTNDLTTWNSDVRIGNRDSVFVTAMDVHYSSGNLFTALLFQGDGNTNRWAMNFSLDGGLTWSETYDWWANYEINDLDAAVVDQHCYVGFSRGTNQDQAFLYQFNAANGSQENFSNGSSYITVFTTTSPVNISEVKLASNQDYYDNRLYYLTISSDGGMRYFWDNPQCTSWTEIATSVTNADRGLSVACNEDYTNRYIFISYIDDSNNLCRGSVNTFDAYESLGSPYALGSSTPRYTTIAAYHDTVMSAFEYHASRLYNKYWISYNAGNSWLWGVIDDTTVTAESPSITARRGGGIAAIYRYYTPTREGRFTWRTYSYMPWQTPTAYADNELWWNQPSIAYLDDGVYGAVYLSWTSPHTRAAYFDRSEPPLVNSITNIVMNPPSPEVINFGDHVDVTFDYNTTEAGGVRIFNLPFTNGSPTPNYAVSGSPLYPVGSGSGSAYFTISSGEVTVDSVRFKMTNADQSVVLLEFFLPVNYHFGTTDIGSSPEASIPSDYILNQNYPNPFNANTNIKYGIPEATNVTVEVYNLLGNRVAALVKEYQQAGYYQVSWDASDCPSGMYFYRVQTADKTMTKRMLLLK